jgi:hypothetical protein
MHLESEPTQTCEKTIVSRLEQVPVIRHTIMAALINFSEEYTTG